MHPSGDGQVKTAASGPVAADTKPVSSGAAVRWAWELTEWERQNSRNALESVKGYGDRDAGTLERGFQVRVRLRDHWQEMSLFGV